MRILCLREALLVRNVSEILPAPNLLCQFHILLKTGLIESKSRDVSLLIAILVFSISYFYKVFDICSCFVLFCFSFPLLFPLLGGSLIFRFFACRRFSVLSALISANLDLSKAIAECLLSLRSCDIYLAAVVILLVFGNKFQTTCFKHP